MIEHPSEQPVPLVQAAKIINLDDYKDVPDVSLPLVASIDHLVKKFNVTERRVVEIGPVPTFHYEVRDGRPGKYNPRASGFEFDESELAPPIRYMADKHPDWHLAAVSYHDIPEADKKRLMGKHGKLFMTRLGPKRTKGIHAFDSSSEGDILQHYPTLTKRLGGRPNIIFGKNIFDYLAEHLFPDHLVTTAARLLAPGGFLVSQTAMSTANNSRLEASSSSPFDWNKNMEHILTISFDSNKPDKKRYVFVYQKRIEE